MLPSVERLSTSLLSGNEHRRPFGGGRPKLQVLFAPKSEHLPNRKEAESASAGTMRGTLRPVAVH